MNLLQGEGFLMGRSQQPSSLVVVRKSKYALCSGVFRLFQPWMLDLALIIIFPLMDIFDKSDSRCTCCMYAWECISSVVFQISNLPTAIKASFLKFCLHNDIQLFEMCPLGQDRCQRSEAKTGLLLL